MDTKVFKFSPLPDNYGDAENIVLEKINADEGISHTSIDFKEKTFDVIMRRAFTPSPPPSLFFCQIL